MQNRQWIFAVIGGLSFVLMTGSLVLASLALAFVFLVNVVLAKQNRRR